MVNKFKSLIDASGRMFRRKYLQNNYPEYLDIIDTFIKSNSLEELPFKQQVYHWFNNISDVQKCYCGKKLKFKNSTIGYYYFCSKKCSDKSNSTKEKRKNTNIKKFGTKTPSESKEVRNKIIKTNIEKYGFNSPMQNDVIKNKSISTLQENYGVDNPNKSEIIIKKRVESFKKNVNNWKENFKNTMIEKYGVNNPLKNDVILNKVKNTNLEKYGFESPMQNKKISSKATNKKIENWINKKLEEDNIVSVDYDNRKYIMNCDCGKDHTFEISFDLYKSRSQFSNYYCTECLPKYFNNISSAELNFNKFIEENYNINKNVKNIINPYELDIYIPELNLAFEFNGLYWHNELHKENNYHKMKSDLCEEKGVQLIHIWEDDWQQKQDIIKSMVLNKLGKSPNKIFARKTEVKEISDNKVIKSFLQENHIQGYVTSSIKIGLFYNDELVSLMTFGKQRKFMNTKSIEGNYELLRFCNKLNNNVVGGASKLFKYFIRNYNYNEITTYADRSYSNGNLYKELGFTFIHKTPPNYYYIINNIRHHRFNFRKDKLIKEGYDSTKTEKQIMSERRIYRIYNAGNYKFVY